MAHLSFKQPVICLKVLRLSFFVKSPQVIPPKITDIEARQDFLRLLVERMQKNPIPSSSPRLTRDMMHERS